MKVLITILILSIFFIAGCTSLSSQPYDSMKNNTSYCSENFPEQYDNNDIVIKVDLDAKHSEYSTLINGNGSSYSEGFMYEGSNTWSKSGTLTQEKINELVMAFKESNFLCMNSNYGNSHVSGYVEYSVYIRIGNVTKQVKFGNGATNFSLIEMIENSVNNLSSSLPSVVCRGLGRNNCMSYSDSDYSFYRSSSFDKCTPLNNTYVNTTGNVIFEQCDLHYFGLVPTVEEAQVLPTYCFYGVNTSEGCMLYVKGSIKYASGKSGQIFNSYKIGDVVRLSGNVSTYPLFWCSSDDNAACSYFILGSLPQEN
jgi:hypothetical protein